MTYVTFVKLLMFTSGVFALLSMLCAGSALFASKTTRRFAMGVVAIICGLVAGALFCAAWNIGSEL